MSDTIDDKVVFPVISIDGPTASGKGTVAHRVAKQLGFHYFGFWGFVSLTALSAIRHGIALDQEQAIADLARVLPCRFEKRPRLS